MRIIHADDVYVGDFIVLTDQKKVPGDTPNPFSQTPYIEPFGGPPLRVVFIDLPYLVVENYVPMLGLSRLHVDTRAYKIARTSSEYVRSLYGEQAFV